MKNLYLISIHIILIIFVFLYLQKTKNTKEEQKLEFLKGSSNGLVVSASYKELKRDAQSIHVRQIQRSFIRVAESLDLNITTLSNEHIATAYNLWVSLLKVIKYEHLGVPSRLEEKKKIVEVIRSPLMNTLITQFTPSFDPNFSRKRKKEKQLMEDIIEKSFFKENWAGLNELQDHEYWKSKAGQKRIAYFLKWGQIPEWMTFSPNYKDITSQEATELMHKEMLEEGHVKDITPKQEEDAREILEEYENQKALED